MNKLKVIVILTVLILASACAAHSSETAPTTPSQPAKVETGIVGGDLQQVALPESMSKEYMEKLNTYAAQLNAISSTKTWRDKTAIGTGFPRMISLPDGRSYEFYVDPGNQYGKATFFFRSADTKKDFPRERVIFTYDQKQQKGYLECRRYAKEGQGVQVENLGEAANAFNEYLAKADKIIAGS